MAPNKPYDPLDIASIKVATGAADMLRTELDRMGGLQRAIADMNAAQQIISEAGGFGRIADQREQARAAVALAMPYSIELPDIMVGYRPPALDISFAISSLPSFHFDVPEVTGLSTAVRDMIEQTKMQADLFRLPDYSAIHGLADAVHRSLNPAYLNPTAGLAERLAEISSPWARTSDEIASATAFAKVQGFGSMLAHVPAFDPEFTDLLRRSLGDWRAPLTLPSGVLDHEVRSELYIEHGFDHSLVEVPDPAFYENMELAGFAFSEPDNQVAGRGDEDAQVRTNQLHAALQRFEVLLRGFIDELMTASFGSDWPRRRLPNGLYDRWLEKQEKDDAGAKWDLIDYADFRDYEAIICRDDNWKEVFAGHFNSKESIRESFQRLYPARLATMHARPLGRDDALFMIFEVRRIFLVIKTIE